MFLLTHNLVNNSMMTTAINMASLSDIVLFYNFATHIYGFCYPNKGSAYHGG
jgi:hypothetical protein